MRVYFVQPPRGIRYNASLLAQLDFEEGRTYREVGYADYEDGQFVNRHKYSEARPVRYSEKDVVFGLIWKPGRVVFLKFKAPTMKTKVSGALGQGQAPTSLVKHRETKSNEKFRTHEQVRRDKAVLKYHESQTGGYWITSNGFTVRPFYLGERPSLLRFPYMVWGDQRYVKGHAAADREVQRWYMAAKREAYNPFARRATVKTLSGVGNTRTMPIKDSDDLYGNAKISKDPQKLGYNLVRRQA